MADEVIPLPNCFDIPNFADFIPYEFHRVVIARFAELQCSAQFGIDERATILTTQELLHADGRSHL